MAKATKKITSMKCLACGIDFIAPRYLIKRGGGKYCSNLCYHKGPGLPKGIVKNCKIHGALTIELCWRQKKGEKIYFKCGACSREYEQKRWQINHEKLLAAHRERVNKNREKVSQSRKKSNIKLKTVIQARKKQQRDSLDDEYIKNLICGKHSIPYGYVPQQMVELYRQNILIKRKIRESKRHGNQEHSRIT